MSEAKNISECLLCAWPCPGCFGKYGKGPVVASLLEAFSLKLRRCGGLRGGSHWWAVCAQGQGRGGPVGRAAGPQKLEEVEICEEAKVSH